MRTELLTFINEQIINKKGFNKTKYIGKLNELIGILKPNSEEDWIRQYTMWAKENGILENIEYIISECVKEYPEISEEAFRQVLRKRIFKDTWIGYNREIQFKKYFDRKTDLILEKTEHYMDTTYAVDYILRDKDNKIILAIQVKPQSYFNSKYISNQKKINFRKYQEFKSIYNLEVIEIGFENGNITHNYDKLFEEVKKIKNI